MWEFIGFSGFNKNKFCNILATPHDLPDPVLPIMALCMEKKLFKGTDILKFWYTADFPKYKFSLSRLFLPYINSSSLPFITFTSALPLGFLIKPA